MTVDVYLAPPSAPCRAVLMTAKCIGLDVNPKNVDLLTKEQYTPEFLEMNPQHCIPTIDDNGFYLWESRAIITYLVNKYAPDSPLYPKDPKERANVDRMLYFDIGTLYKALGAYLYPQMLKGEAADPEKEVDFKKALGLLETFLSKTPYAAGSHLTLADISIFSTLTFTQIINYSYAEYPKITAYIEKLKSEIPCYEEINEKPLKWLKEWIDSKK